jgi:hypothetical protein
MRATVLVYASSMPRSTRPSDSATTSSAPTGSAALRSLVGAGPSQVGVVGALRARDVSRPDDEQLARAAQAPTRAAGTTRRPGR